MKLELAPGTTSKIIRVKMVAAADGTGTTGLAFSDMTITYIREGDAGETAITPVAGTIGTWLSGGWLQVDATNMPGVYEFGTPDACLANGSESVVIQFRATDQLSTEVEITLTARRPGDLTL